MDGKENVSMLYGEKPLTFEALLKDMEQVGIVPIEINEKEDWDRRYEDWMYRLQKSYEEAMQKEELDDAFAFTRKYGKVAKTIKKFASTQENAYLYSMGTFVGVFHAMSGMLPKRNEAQIFHIKMAELKGRVYVKQALEFLYGQDFIQHKELCDKLGISPSQLNRVMGELTDVGCVRKYESGKYVFYSLTLLGRNYVHEFLGCRTEAYMEYDSVALAGQKPQIGERGSKLSTSRLAAEYRIDNANEDMVKYAKLANVELSYGKVRFGNDVFLDCNKM